MNETIVVESVPKYELSREAELGWSDILVFGAIIGVAFFYVYRKLWLNRGKCSDCGPDTEETSPCGGCGSGSGKIENIERK